MPLKPMIDLMEQARSERRALPAFELWNSANIFALCEAAAATRRPVILQASPVEINLMGGAEAVRHMVEFYVGKTGIEAALHLDHGTTLDQVRDCVAAGFTSVMMDASRKSFQENIELSRSTVEIAKPAGVSVEAELGHVGGAEGELEDEGHSANDFLTDPAEAEQFVSETGIDCLAVAIGTIHGDYRGEPNINLERLDEIAERVSLPLVLHGGSGTPEDKLRGCIERGIAKINICTEIHKAWLGGIEEARGRLTPSVPGKFYEPAHAVLRDKAIGIIEFFAGNRSAAA